MNKLDLDITTLTKVYFLHHIMCNYSVSSYLCNLLTKLETSIYEIN